MRIKRYVGRTMKEALNMARSELGEDVLILSTRKLRRGGFLGLFGGEVVFEVTAAVEEHPETRTPLKSPSSPATRSSGYTRQSTDNAASLYQLREILGKNVKMQGESLQQQNKEKSFGGGETALSELEEIKSMLGNLQRLVLRGRANYPPPYDLLAELLTSQEMEEDFIERIVRSMMVSCGTHCEMNEFFWTQLLEAIVYSVKTEVPLPKGKMMFIGPTGAGKTTTVAKLAARYHLDMGVDLMLVTVDTFRIAATDQLRTYAELIGVPFAVAYTPKELSYILKEAESHDLILIDTAGKNPHSEMHINELKAFMNVGSIDVVYLVSSAVTRRRDLFDIYQKMGEIGVTHLIFTKLDETKIFGSLIDLTRISGLPVAYFTDGQRVPDDIKEADPRFLASLLIEEVKSSGRRSSNRIEKDSHQR